jgi:hypothetical protein
MIRKDIPFLDKHRPMRGVHENNDDQQAYGSSDGAKAG